MTDLLTIADLRVEIDTGADVVSAVRGIDLNVKAGETLCIVGESGCGKSMTMLSLLNLMPRGARRSAEQLSFDGIDLRNMAERALEDLRGDRIGMIFQDPMAAFNPSFTIGEQLEEIHIRHRRLGRAAARARALELLQRVGVTAPAERLKQYPHQMSGGLRQRAMIAMALMCEPRLVLADEPTTALDVTTQAQVLRLLRSLQRELGIGLVLITHDLGVVAAIADRVAVMYAGQIVEHGPASAIFEAPSHPYTRGLLACAPQLGRMVKGKRLGNIPGHVPSNIGATPGCSFADRCTESMASCRISAIDTVDLGDGHGSRCLLAIPEARACVNG
jgi:peptide/nickel transport system ATP-binding protein